jgi:hypothetical protein
MLAPKIAFWGMKKRAPSLEGTGPALWQGWHGPRRRETTLVPSP